MNTLSLKDLANELDDLRERAEDTSTDENAIYTPLDEDEKDTLAELIAVEDTLGDLHVYSKNHDDCLIEEDDFEEFIQDDMESMCDLSNLPEVIKRNIDWRAVADDCEHDYHTITYQGTDYLIRAS